jgi:hypothetical protein
VWEHSEGHGQWQQSVNLDVLEEPFGLLPFTDIHLYTGRLHLHTYWLDAVKKYCQTYATNNALKAACLSEHFAILVFLALLFSALVKHMWLASQLGVPVV